MCFIIAPKYWRHFVGSDVMQNHWLVSFSATCIGENIPSPPGIQNNAWWWLPESFSMTFLSALVVNLLIFWSRSRIFHFFPLVGAVCSPVHWISILGFISHAPMFCNLCLVYFHIMNHLLHVEWPQRAGKWHECHATCNVRDEEDVLDKNYLYRQWNHLQTPLWYQWVLPEWLDAEMLESWSLQTCSKGVLCYPLLDRIWCPLQFMILYRKRWWFTPSHF